MRLKTNETEKQRILLIMKDKTLNALELCTMLVNTFRIGTYLPIIDTLIAEVRTRKFVYCILQQNFNFWLNLIIWAISDIEHSASKSLKVYAAIMIATFLQKLCTSLFIYVHLLILV